MIVLLLLVGRSPSKKKRPVAVVECGQMRLLLLVRLLWNAVKGGIAVVECGQMCLLQLVRLLLNAVKGIILIVLLFFVNRSPSKKNRPAAVLECGQMHLLLCFIGLLLLWNAFAMVVIKLDWSVTVVECGWYIDCSEVFFWRDKDR